MICCSRRHRASNRSSSQRRNGRPAAGAGRRTGHSLMHCSGTRGTLLLERALYPP